MVPNLSIPVDAFSSIVLCDNISRIIQEVTSFLKINNKNMSYETSKDINAKA